MSNKTNGNKIIKPDDLKISKLDKKINKLLNILNLPETGCKFWRRSETDMFKDCHILGIRPVKRNCVEIINANGFNPFEKKTEENLFKFYTINIVEKDTKYTQTNSDIEKRFNYEKEGIIYMKESNLICIYDFIRNNT